MAWYTDINWTQVASAGIGAFATVYGIKRQERAEKLRAAEASSLLAAMYNPSGSPGGNQLNGKGYTQAGYGAPQSAGVPAWVWPMVIVGGGVLLIVAVAGR